MKRMLTILSACLLISACGESVKITEDSEIVLKEGTTLSVETPQGTLQVIAKQGTKRKYIWNDCKMSSRLDLRAERWYGKLGMYDPNASYMPLFNDCNNMAKPVVEEAQMHFLSQEDLDVWLSKFNRKSPYYTVWDKTGLVVRFVLIPNGENLNISVTQLCVNGQKPTDLQPSSVGSLSISGNSQDPLYACNVVDREVVVEGAKDWIKLWIQDQKRNSAE